MEFIKKTRILQPKIRIIFTKRAILRNFLSNFYIKNIIWMAFGDPFIGFIHKRPFSTFIIIGNIKNLKKWIL